MLGYDGRVRHHSSVYNLFNGMFPGKSTMERTIKRFELTSSVTDLVGQEGYQNP